MDYDSRRRHMVEWLVSEGILRRKEVIDAMLKVPRHLFVPDEAADSAYADYPQPIGFNQTISAPHMVAIMSELLDVYPDSKVLEVGTGSGYQAAVLSQLTPDGSVVSVERIPELAAKARDVLDRLGYRNITVVEGDGTLGVPEYAPYQRIIVTAAAPKVPDTLVGELSVGGKMLIPLGDRWSQTLMEIVKDMDGKTKAIPHGGCVFVPLIGREGW